MAYQILLGGMLFPVAPSKIDVKIPSGNKTVELVDGTEMNILKAAKLNEISFTAELPGTRGRSYAVYEHGFQPPGYFLQRIEGFMRSGEPVDFCIVRLLPNGLSLHNTMMQVSIGDCTITDDAKQGFDTTVKIDLRQHTKADNYSGSLAATPDGGMALVLQKYRAISMAALPMQTSVVTALVGDTLWSIAKRYLGDGAKFTELAALNNVNNSGVAEGQLIKVR